jgi:hypothetical protein
MKELFFNHFSCKTGIKCIYILNGSSTFKLIFFLLSLSIYSLQAQTYEWNLLGSGDKSDLYSELNYINIQTGMSPVDNSINPNTEVNSDICIRSGEIGGTNGVSDTLKMGTGGLTVENAFLKMNTTSGKGIDLGTGNRTFTINNAKVKTQFVTNATIVMDGRSELILDGDVTCLDNTTIEIKSPDAFVTFTNLRPTIANFLLSKITANNSNTSGTKRLSQYYLGSTVSAVATNNNALHVFSGKNQSGYLDSFKEGFYGKIGINSSFTMDGINSYSIVGFGYAISDTEDMFHFAYRKLTGNSEIIARCDTIENNNSISIGGLMMRASLEHDAAFIMVAVRPDKQLYVMCRENKGATAINLNGVTGGTTSKKYIRLLRQDNQYSAYYSTESVAGPWIQLGDTKSISLNDEAYVGLARCGAEGAMPAKSHFSEVELMQENVAVSDSTFGQFEAHTDVYKPCPYDDQISSFMLKKGYEICISSDGAGQGYSQVWVATENDIYVDLPEQLDHKSSYFRIVPWRWISKKGWGGSSTTPVLTGAYWSYEWEPTGNSSDNIEFVPMIKGRVQNKNYRWEEVRSRGGQTHMLGFNEPMNEKQGDLTVDEAINLWTKELAMGLRLGSPARTDGDKGDTWLKDFMQKAELKGLRVDFVCVHNYNKTSASALRSWLNAEYEKYKKPIWLTEFNTELTTSAGQEKYMAEVTRMLEDAPFIERYAYFNTGGVGSFFNSTKTGLSPLGQIYYNTPSKPAFVSTDPTNGLDLILTATLNNLLTVNISTAVNSNNIQSVEYFINGVSVGETTSPPFNLSSFPVTDKFINVIAVLKTIFGESQFSNTVQLVNTSTGTSDVYLPQIKFTPNPFKDNISLSETAEWTLLNLKGQAVQTGKSKMINTSLIPNGMYLLKINEKMHKILKL